MSKNDKVFEYSGFDSYESILILSLAFATRLEKKVEINCENKTITCMTEEDLEKAKKVLNDVQD